VQDQSEGGYTNEVADKVKSYKAEIHGVSDKGKKKRNGEWGTM